MMFSNIEVIKDDRVAFITINREEVRNALNKETLGEISAALKELNDDISVGCVVFTGKGEKSFAAGADIAQLKEKSTIDVFKAGGMQEVYDEIEAYDKPTIAMINGFALGGGCELAMACDIRVASTNAKMGLPELNLAIIPGAGGTQRLVRIVGKGKALELILTGKIIGAEEAERIGLVSSVAEPDQLLETVMVTAHQMLSKGPLALKLAKIAVHAGSEADMKTGLLIEKLAQGILFSSEDKEEGTQAFLEKRKANFVGK
ncbi:enoyl-CoA hydratase/isomerase family protein [Bacillus sp. H-16]|uniref:enoyl-CoA hydratase/isomerase family protein n=1 Tax=Alteribacter salitolerans TaxID=2912333 RepID=UPI001962535A|nr:enoyl-CoA hydratase-related protein [Alteribacter salitolerans]MBM7096668.1 enoyl-CoA hydratase/isomerase family protein [Alteribacter salitolerans]